MPKIPRWIFALVALLHLSALYVDVMDIDASQYAEISREMMLSGDYLHIYDRGIDYLDKPPLLFWISAISMKIFGVSNAAYKLPSVLLALWALYATYRLARLLYDEHTARMAALILGTCQGLFLMTNDIRTDTALMSWVITAVWMIKECDIRRRWYYVLGGCAALALGMMTKGPIALMVPVFCLGSDWLLKRQWKKIFNPLHLLDIAIVAILLIPMSIGLYQQFDMQPEKTVNGVQGGVSGLRFFYWSQSFGRITGESPWDNGAPFEFLLVSMLWAFLPWMFFFLPALFVNIAKLIRQRFRLHEGQEFLTTGSFLLAYIALGSSRYQLPHYIFVVFPLAAIMTAEFINDLVSKGHHKKLFAILRPAQTVISFLVLIAALLTVVFVFPASAWIIAAWCIALGIWLYLLLQKRLALKFFWLSVLSMLLANVFLTHHFYRTLLTYQAGSMAGKYIHDHQLPSGKVFIYKVEDPLNSSYFYAQQVIPRTDTSANITTGQYILTQQPGLTSLQREGKGYRILQQRDFFKVSELTGAFLNPATRGEVVKRYYLVEVQ